ncbi:hypothetical protein ACYJ1Y_00365 [Natrialbaceae archaeon A-gly3]
MSLSALGSSIVLMAGITTAAVALSAVMVAFACLFFLFVALAPELSGKWASEFAGTTRSSNHTSKSD